MHGAIVLVEWKSRGGLGREKFHHITRPRPLFLFTPLLLSRFISLTEHLPHAKARASIFASSLGAGCFLDWTAVTYPWSWATVHITAHHDHMPFHRTQPSPPLLFPSVTSVICCTISSHTTPHPLPFPSVTSVICCIFSATGIRVTSPKGSRTLHLQTSGEKAYNVACLSTPGENWVPSARQNRKILYTLLKQKRRQQRKKKKKKFWGQKVQNFL